MSLLLWIYIYTDSIYKQESSAKANKAKERLNKNKEEPVNSVNFWLELLAAADQLMLSQLKTIAASIIIMVFCALKQ